MVSLKTSQWWRHQMETFSALLAICAENSPVTGEFPAQRHVTRSFDVFFDLCLNKRLSKQSWGWWLGMPLRPLWRHSNFYFNGPAGIVRFQTLSQKFRLDLWRVKSDRSRTGSRLNIKTVFPGYRDSHYKDKTVVRPSYLYNGNPYAGKMTYGPQVLTHVQAYSRYITIIVRTLEIVPITRSKNTLFAEYTAGLKKQLAFKLIYDCIRRKAISILAKVAVGCTDIFGGLD